MGYMKDSAGRRLDSFKVADAAAAERMFAAVENRRLERFAATATSAWNDPGGWSSRLLDRDRNRIIGFDSDEAGLKIGTSVDGGATFTTRHTFTASTAPSRDMVAEDAVLLSSGELLVATSGPDYLGAWWGSVWRSTGWQADPSTATWARVDESPYSRLVSTPSGLYGGLAYDGDQTVMAAWYGPQSNTTKPASDAGHLVRKSSNRGATWTTVFDLSAFLTAQGIPVATLTAPNGHHVHSIAYDKWWGAWWLNFGDASGGGYCGTLYSLDGANWEIAYLGTGPWQGVRLIPMQDRILSLGDGGSSSGVNAFPRDPSKPGTFSAPVKAYGGALTTAIGMGASVNPEPGGWVIIALTQITGSTRVSRLVATTDGVQFYELFIDGSYTVSGVNGFRWVIGPDPKGRIIAMSPGTGGYSGGVARLVLTPA